MIGAAAGFILQVYGSGRAEIDRLASLFAEEELDIQSPIGKTIFFLSINQLLSSIFFKNDKYLIDLSTYEDKHQMSWTSIVLVYMVVVTIMSKK